MATEYKPKRVMVWVQVSSYEFKTHCQRIDAYLDDWQVALTAMRAKVMVFLL
jgi:hypothetical protein